ncbi:hypothetical protein ACHAXR_002843 [Thalassiosira sp. AJA248-18]
MVDVWRKNFVLAESMLEMECTCLAPAVVLKTQNCGNPDDKSHPNFSSVASKELVLFGDQLGSGNTETIAVGEAASSGLVNNETLAYFMAQTQLFMEKIGMDPTRLRFCQHLTTEMAHYACDCWDLEIQSSYGWVECVGHADRACYDLVVHSKATKTPMVATLKLNEAREVILAKLKFDKKSLGRRYLARTPVDKSTAALGRRYARVDEIGVPFAVTVDCDSSWARLHGADSFAKILRSEACV